MKPERNFNHPRGRDRNMSTMNLEILTRLTGNEPTYTDGLLGAAANSPTAFSDLFCKGRRRNRPARRQRAMDGTVSSRTTRRNRERRRRPARHRRRMPARRRIGQFRTLQIIGTIHQPGDRRSRRPARRRPIRRRRQQPAATRQRLHKKAATTPARTPAVGRRTRTHPSQRTPRGRMTTTRSSQATGRSRSSISAR